MLGYEGTHTFIQFLLNYTGEINNKKIQADILSANITLGA